MRSGVTRKSGKQPVAHAVERASQRRKPLGGGAEHGVEPVLARRARDPTPAEAAAAERVVVRHVGARFAQVPGRDIIGKEAGEPERVVAEVDHHPEAPLAVARLEVGEDVDQIAVLLVVMPVDPPGPVPLPEIEQQRGEVVGQLAVVDAGAAAARAAPARRRTAARTGPASCAR